MRMGSIHPGRLPIADGRSSEATFARRLRAQLAEQVGGSPTASQRLLIDRIATIALRVRMIDTNPELPDRVEYLDLTRLLADLLAQLGAGPPSACAVRSGLREVAA